MPIALEDYFIKAGFFTGVFISGFAGCFRSQWKITRKLGDRSEPEGQAYHQSERPKGAETGGDWSPVDNRFHVLVKPNAKKTEILGYDAERNAIRIAIAAPPENNKANKELLKFISRTLKKKVSFVSGLRSKEKVLEITP